MKVTDIKVHKHLNDEKQGILNGVSMLYRIDVFTDKGLYNVSFDDNLKNAANAFITLCEYLNGVK